MPLILPRASSGEAVSVFSYPSGKTGGAQSLVANASVSARSVPFSDGCAVISVTSNAAFTFEVGDNTVTANSLSHYGIANTQYDIALIGGFNTRTANHLAVATLVGNAQVYISARF